MVDFISMNQVMKYNEQEVISVALWATYDKIFNDICTKCRIIIFIM